MPTRYTSISARTVAAGQIGLERMLLNPWREAVAQAAARLAARIDDEILSQILSQVVQPEPASPKRKKISNLSVLAEAERNLKG